MEAHGQVPMRLYTHARLTDQEMADELGDVSRQQVERWRRKLGLPMNGCKGRKRVLWHWTAERLLLEGKGRKVIARLLGKGYGAVKEALHRMGHSTGTRTKRKVG